MAVRDIDEQVRNLIGRRVAEAKVDGSNSPDIEARALIESIALNLILKPKAVLYLAHLARNALTVVVDKEISDIDAMIKTVNDLANTTYTITSALHLDNARNALLQMEGLEKIDLDGNSFSKFDRAINDFLNKSLSKTIRKKGSSELSRPDIEAAADLPIDFATLISIHQEMLDRLYSLAVGVDNFSSSPLGTILGLATIYRARSDIEEIIELINNGDSGPQSRDVAIRVISDRASIKSVGSLPSIFEPVLDSSNSTPIGYSLKAQSELATASVLGSIGPYVLTPGASASVTVNGSNLTFGNFPQSGLDLANRAFISSADGITYPVTVSSGYFLFIHLVRLTSSIGYILQDDGTYIKSLRIGFTSGPRTITQIITDLNTALGSDGLAAEYISTGSGRIIIIANSPIVSLSIASSHSEPSTSTVGDVNVFINSAHSILGFIISQRGDSGSTPLSIVVDSFNLLFGSLVIASRTEDQRPLVETLADSIGTAITVTTDSAIGLNGTEMARSNRIRLYGNVNGVETDPVNPDPILDISDTVSTPSGGSTVQGLTIDRIILADDLDTFNGDITITSSLVLAFRDFDNNVQTFLTAWLGTEFSKNLDVIDRAVAVLNGRATPASRNAVNSILGDLRNHLVDLKTALLSGQLPIGSGIDEKRITDGIVASLSERRLDRALDFVLRLKVQEFFELGGENSSYGGNLLKSMSDMANSDIVFPNIALDEDDGFKALVKEPEA